MRNPPTRLKSPALLPTAPGSPSSSYKHEAYHDIGKPVECLVGGLITKKDESQKQYLTKDTRDMEMGINSEFDKSSRGRRYLILILIFFLAFQFFQFYVFRSCFFFSIWHLGFSTSQHKGTNRAGAFHFAYIGIESADR